MREDYGKFHGTRYIILYYIPGEVAGGRGGASGGKKCEVISTSVI